MKKYAALMLVIAVASTTFATPVQAADDSAVKKVGNAITWPFRKVGQGLKAMGNGAKKLVKRD